MKNLALSIILFTLFLGIAHEADAKEFPVPAHGSILLPVPENWVDGIKQAPSGAPPTIRFSQSIARSSKDQFLLQITPRWKGPRSRRNFGSPESLRAAIDSMAKHIAPTAVEKSIEIKPVGGSKTGFYFSITDKAWKPGNPEDYRYMTSGVLAVGKLVAAFTLLRNDKGSDVLGLSLEMLQKAEHKP